MGTLISSHNSQRFVLQVVRGLPVTSAETRLPVLISKIPLAQRVHMSAFERVLSLGLAAGHQHLLAHVWRQELPAVTTCGADMITRDGAAIILQGTLAVFTLARR